MTEQTDTATEVAADAEAAADAGAAADAAVEAPEQKPLFAVTAGNPTDEELAALTVVLAAAASGGGDAEPEQHLIDGWAAPHRFLRSIGAPGPGSWRAEFAPR